MFSLTSDPSLHDNAVDVDVDDDDQDPFFLDPQEDILPDYDRVEPVTVDPANAFTLEYFLKKIQREKQRLAELTESSAADTQNRDGEDTAATSIDGDTAMLDSNAAVDTDAWHEESSDVRTVKMEISPSDQLHLEGASHSSSGTSNQAAKRLKLINTATRPEYDISTTGTRQGSMSSDPSSAKGAKRQSSSTPDAKDSLDVSHSGTPTTTRPYHRRPSPPEPRPRSSIPTDVPLFNFANQCLVAAESSRLDPYRLHKEEYQMLKDHVTQKQVTIYLNIRNAILRLWMMNPLTSVPREEALGCAKESRYFALAEVCYQWLIRRGYINFGCLHLSSTVGSIVRATAKSRRRTVVIIGAGVSGMGCARQLTGLFNQFGSKFSDNGEKPPRIIILEGSNRIGGRVYSHPLRKQNKASFPQKGNMRCTAEMGAQIVTGFERGNPLNILLRGQLALHLYPLTDNTLLYDSDGKPIDQEKDQQVQKLYNDILDRATTFKSKTASFETAEGDSELIYWHKDPTTDGNRVLSALDSSEAATGLTGLHSRTSKNTTVTKAGRDYVVGLGEQQTLEPAAKVAKTLGWKLKPGVSETQDVELDDFVRARAYPTLGETMDEAIRQYQSMIDLTPQDLRLLSWHHANQEYGNAVNVNQLSLSNWDQDLGNEFDGRHSEIIGGYQQLVRGLWHAPSQLDVRFRKEVKTIEHCASISEGTSNVKIVCRDGEVFEADLAIMTTSLGVLKANTLKFNPALPEWKQGAIDRLGFGLLNKVILIFEQPFWEQHRDMFGLLNDPQNDQASLELSDYTAARGRLYLFWDRTTQSGRPALVALMAGDAAHECEKTSDEVIISAAIGKLQSMFPTQTVPMPSETIITRWKSNPFVRGSYSYVGPQGGPSDYDDMARSVGPLFFAGEATCGTHPATVHGAYLSGLRAASEVIDTLLGPIPITEPLIAKRTKVEENNIYGLPAPLLTEGHRGTANSAARAEDQEYIQGMNRAVLEELGPKPLRPLKLGVNPFLLYTKDFWHKCKADCDEAKRKTTSNPDAKATKVEIRTALGHMWRTAADDVKQPYLDASNVAKETSAAQTVAFKEAVVTWEKEAARISQEYLDRIPMGYTLETALDLSKLEIPVPKH